MTYQNENDGLTRSYLLGALSAEEQQHVEERMLTDDEFFQQLLVAEDDLFDEYVRGELTEEEKRLFQNNFLAAQERQQGLQFAEALNRYVSTAAPAGSEAPSLDVKWPRQTSKSGLREAFFGFRNSWAGLAVAASLLVMIFGGLWLATKNLRSGREQALTQTQQGNAPVGQQNQTPQVAEKRGTEDQSNISNPASANNQTGNKLALNANQPQILAGNRSNKPDTTAPPANKQRPNSSVVIALATGALRGEGGLKKVEIPQGIATAQLHIALEPSAGQYKSYRAVMMMTDSGQTVLSKAGLRARTNNRGEMIFLSVRAASLKPGDYQVVISGLTADGEYENVGTYYFRVLNP